MESRTGANMSMTGSHGYCMLGSPLPRSLCDGLLLVLCILPLPARPLVAQHLVRISSRYTANGSSIASAARQISLPK